MFGTTPPTPYDIEFSLFGIPVRIHPLFWVIGILLGWRLEQADLITIWVLCLFVSILIHEMGHALMIRAFGYSPHIVLHHFGGYAAYLPGRGHSLWKSVAISFAGPLAGFCFFGVIVVTQLAMVYFQYIPSDQLWFAMFQLEWINLGWGLINLLPVIPLDGGQICRDLLLMVNRQGELWACRIGVVTGVLVAALFLQWQMTYAAVMFGVLAFFNYQAMSQGPRQF